jgi:hypothetical protein
LRTSAAAPFLAAFARSGDSDFLSIGRGFGTAAYPIRQYLIAGQIDEVQLGVSPVLLSEGEPLFPGINLRQLGFADVRVVPGEKATHVFIKKR